MMSQPTVQNPSGPCGVLATVPRRNACRRVLLDEIVHPRTVQDHRHLAGEEGVLGVARLPKPLEKRLIRSTPYLRE